MGALSARNHLTETKRSALDRTSPRCAHGRSALTAADSQGHCQHNYLERCWLSHQRNIKHTGFQKEAAGIFKTSLPLKHIPCFGDGPAGNSQVGRGQRAGATCPHGHKPPPRSPPQLGCSTADEAACSEVFGHEGLQSPHIYPRPTDGPTVNAHSSEGENAEQSIRTPIVPTSRSYLYRHMTDQDCQRQFCSSNPQTLSLPNFVLVGCWGQKSHPLLRDPTTAADEGRLPFKTHWLVLSHSKYALKFHNGPPRAANSASPPQTFHFYFPSRSLLPQRQKGRRESLPLSARLQQRGGASVKELPPAIVPLCP